MRARPLNADALAPALNWDPRDEDEADCSRVNRDYEWPVADWEPIPPRAGAVGTFPLPSRFIDGSIRTRVVGTIQDSRGRQRPLVLASLGAVALSLGQLSPEGRYPLDRGRFQVETCLVILANGLAARDLEVIRDAVGSIGVRLVAPTSGQVPDDFEKTRLHTVDFARLEMLAHESRILRFAPDVPTIVDGLLDKRLDPAGSHDLPAVGVVKRQGRTYLHQAGVNLIYSLRPGQRTPAFLLDTTRGKYVTFYLRLGANAGDLPTSGVVRVALSQEFFENRLESDWDYLSALADWLCRLRCLDGSYPRASVSIEPIVRVEDHLSALLPDLDERVGAFNHLFGLQVAARRVS